jgi:hypothetical protein
MDWKTSYRAAVLETDPQKMPERVALAREAINAALTAPGSPEAEPMHKALESLNVLEADARTWPKGGRFAR